MDKQGQNRDSRDKKGTAEKKGTSRDKTGTVMGKARK